MYSWQNGVAILLRGKERYALLKEEAYIQE